MNVYKPLIINNIMHTMKLLRASCVNMGRYLFENMKVNEKTVNRYVERSLMLATALNPVIGYDGATRLVKYADKHDLSLVEANEALKLLDSRTLKKLIDPKNMI